LEVIVVDSSAIIAILLDEPDATAFLSALASATDARLSAVTNYEIRTVAFSRGRNACSRNMKCSLRRRI